MSRKAEIILDFQNMIEHAPASPEQLYAQAASNDGPTVNAWKDQWIKQVRENHKTHGPFKERGVGKLWGTMARSPVIIAGSGPSLKHNGALLKNRAGIPLISCLHNFHFLEDNDAPADYYVSLDAGQVTVEEVSEGGKRTPDEYWALTKDRTLLAFVGSHPELLAKWQGKIYFFTCAVPAIDAALEEVEPFATTIGTGGNVLGACFYLAKGIFGGNPIAFVGADFAFGYDRKFHPWDSKYDAQLGNVVKMIDVYGNKVLSWQSYINFKSWFECMFSKVPGLYVNCTEGGTLGAYPEGNIAAIKQMELATFLNMYKMHEHLRAQCEDPTISERTLLF